jgi:23S rRNA pseudouridine1911/1915/1917 synthase
MHVNVDAMPNPFEPEIQSHPCPPTELPPLQILLEDGPVLAVNKPAGVLTQGVPHGIPTLESQVKAFLKERYQKQGNVYLGIPHRLDRPVSGVLVFARNSKAARRLAEQFQQRQVRKIYWGVVETIPEPAEGTLTDWLLKLPDQARAEIVPAESTGARECSLRYRTIATASNLTLLEIELLTGRMHQIRVQLASRGWHLVGDFPYGAHRALRAERSHDPRAEPIALHARSLTFLHPVRYDSVTVTAPTPVFWQSLGVIGKGET